jgi:hypothetical protein
MAEGKAGELAKGLVAVRARAEVRDRDAIGNLKLAAAVGGYIMLQPPKGGSLATPLFIFVCGTKTSNKPGVRLFRRLSNDHER